MKTDTVLFAQALGRSSELAKHFAPASPSFLVWLKEHNLPEEIVAHFFDYSLVGDSCVEIGFANFWPEKYTRKWHDETPEYLAAGWLIVGSMQNGDFVVINFGRDDGAVGYVSHEEIWDEPHHVRDDLESIYLRVCESFGQFLDGLTRDEHPYDYFDAKEQLG